MREVTFAASVHLIFLITGPVIHAVEQRLTRRYDLIVADDWRFGNFIERVEEEMMTQNSGAGANEVPSISLESLRPISSNPAVLGVCSATWAPQTMVLLHRWLQLTMKWFRAFWSLLRCQVEGVNIYSQEPTA
jgi:hypothetical protein